ncbi:54S ribosomal protein L33, mitochondrial [Purpureocillium lavendulum]|uniref:54S ribosomal protein L33, mitochondrial n=1 Tax=Purpureocillium lavendulum TaxID=1247861 RepID=A0AB34FU50_9HYPO|nr:54S ribosomal protein L33, mitochondrial [Purpureocillium lavendulum]
MTHVTSATSIPYQSPTTGHQPPAPDPTLRLARPTTTHLPPPPSTATSHPEPNQLAHACAQHCIPGHRLRPPRHLAAMSADMSADSGMHLPPVPFQADATQSVDPPWLTVSLRTAAPNLNLTPEEKRVYGDLFKQADPENLRVVTGDAAVSFFDKTRLDSRVLGEIWQIADKENRGFLTPVGFGIVLRLIGHAQAGREPRPDLAFQPAPLPRFEGIHTPAAAASPALQAQGTGGGVRIPPLTPDKVAQYTSLFERQSLQGNMLSGDQARQIFDKSGMPNETLGRIWALADTEQRGALVLAEFIIAMHLLTSMKTGALRALPTVLPAGLYEAATQRGSISGPRQSPASTGLSAIPRQLSGTAQPRTGSPLGRTPASPQTTGPAANDWAITPADKERFDQIYATLDKTKKGYITGDEAVPFFSQSNLSEDALAQIWDLADFNSQGQLNPEAFAVAMYLIRQQRSGRAAPLPATLPANLIPPSMRNQPRPAAPSSAFDPPPMTQPPPPQPKSALEDLFGLDSSSPSPAPAAPIQTTMSTGGSNANDPFGGGSAVLSPSSPVRGNAPGSTFKPFVPSSTFGRGLTVHSTGDKPGPGTRQGQSDDLLDDHDPEASKKISGETTELANLSNQIGSLSKEMQDVQSKRTTVQNDLNQSNSQKQNFEQRLAQLRTLYEKEAEDTRALEEQLRKSRSETQKLQSECMSLEGQYRDVQAQHQQVSSALQADQQENTKLRERIRVVNGEIAQLKPQIDKLKSDARQQKGLVAINKKQLATTEGERDKLKTEAEELTKANEDASRHIESSSPVSASAQVASPALSSSSGNNPFFKRTASTDIMGAFSPPAPRGVPDKSFDDVFGPSFPVVSTSTPPPPTAFHPQNTGNSAASGASYNTASSTPQISRQGTLAAEPPAPPESRQISSSFLPFPDHTESLSSSRQVSPPASRAEGSIADSTSTPLPGETASAGGAAPVTQDTSPSDHGDNDETPSPTPAAGDAKPAAAGETAPKTGASPAPMDFRKTDEAKAKADFDNAFAAFTSSNKGQTPAGTDGAKAQSAFDSEFPPISELERDDESESDSERGGFDDDFTPTSPRQKHDAKAAEPEPASEVKQSEVPTAKEPAEGTNRGADAHAPKPAATANDIADDIFGSTATTQAPSSSVPANTATKGAFDDLDDDFEGLEDAKEGSADDDFANISRDDFNPVFDSSPPASQTKSESTAFGNESSFDFVPSHSAAGANASVGGAQQKAAENHDWDAIFAGLDSPSTVTPPGLSNGGATAQEDKKDSRPTAPGRALTDQGEHDDPILKNLTGMGYSRADAVAALEKYDYNLERALTPELAQAANYLATHRPHLLAHSRTRSLDLAHDGLGPAGDVNLGGAGLDGVEHGALKVVAGAEDGLDPAELQVPVGVLEGLELVGDGVLVGGEEAEEGLGDAPLDEELVGEDLGEDVDEGVVQHLAVIVDVLLKRHHHLLHGRVGVPAGREEVGHDGLEVDGEDELRKLGDAPGAEVDVAVAQRRHLLVGALEVLRRDVRLDHLPEVRQVAKAALVLVVVDARDLVVGRRHEPVLQRLEALEVGHLARLVAQRLVLEQALPRLLARAQPQEHGVDDALDHVGALRVGPGLDLLAQHSPQRHQVLGPKVAVLVLVEVGALDVALRKVLLLLREDAVDPLVEELDDELPEVAHQLRLAVVDDVRRQVLLAEAQLGHLLVVLLREAHNLQRVSGAPLRVVDNVDEEVVHHLVVYVCVRLGDPPLLGHQRRHSDLDGVEVVKVPLHNFLELRRVVEELFPGLLELLLGAEFDGLHELVLVAADLFRAVGDALEPHRHLLVVLEGLLQRQDALVAALLGLHDHGEAHHQAVVVVDDEVDEVHGQDADVLVEPVDGVVEPRKVVLERRLQARVVGSLDLLHGVVPDVAQLRQLVVAGQQVGHVLLVVVVLAQHVLDDGQAVVEGLEIPAHRLDGAKVASLIMVWDSEQSLSMLIISSLIICTVFWPSLRPVMPDCVVSSCSRRPLRSWPSTAPFLRENSSFSAGILSRSSGCRSSSDSFGAGVSSMSLAAAAAAAAGC